MLSVDRQRWFDQHLGPALCWLLTVWHRVRGRRPPPSDIRRILVIVLSEMGALVLARPMFERVRERHPAASLFVLCFKKNREALDVLGVVPRDRVIPLQSDSLLGFLGDSVRVIRELRALSFDVVLDLELFARTSAIFSGVSGAPVRVGFDRHTQEGLYRGGFVNRPVLYNPYQHIAQQFVTLAEAIDSATVPTGKRLVGPDGGTTPHMPLEAGELEAARRLLHSRFEAVRGRRLVLLGPGAGLLPLRAWPIDHYSVIARRLLARGFGVGIVGLPEDRPLAETIQAAANDAACVDLTGYTRSVRELIVLFNLGELLITNDGGTAHFASLTPIPTIVLYGPETPTLYGSRSPRAINLHKPLSCSPCLTAYNHRRSPCDGDNVCLKSISPDEVLAAAARLLDAGMPA